MYRSLFFRNQKNSKTKESNNWEITVEPVALSQILFQFYFFWKQKTVTSINCETKSNNTPTMIHMLWPKQQ
jgi:hypothetical protein